MENTNTIILDINDNPFTKSFINYIYIDIDYIFPLLNSIEKDLIKKMMISLLTLIYFKFHFESVIQFYNQLSNNNNQDIRMILLLLLPFIDDKNNFQIHKSIVNLKDLSIKTSSSENEYKTNIQYDRYFNSKKDESNIQEYEYNIMDVYNNYVASYYTINKCAHHLYCNWDQIIPLTLTNYSDSYIYKDTIETIRNQQIPNNTSLKGLDARDFYHSFANDMYYDILPYKWLIYERYDTSLGKDIMYLDEIINYFTTFDISDSDEINKYNRTSFITKWPEFIILNPSDIVYNILLHFNNVAQDYLPDDKIDKLEISPDDVYELDDNNETIRRIPKNEIKALLLDKYNNKEYIEYIYEFLCDTFIQFSSTWYGKLIFPNKKFGKKDIIYLKDQIFNKTQKFNIPVYTNSYVSYKNIYNFVKNLVILDYSNKIVVREWDSLTDANKNIILNRLNGGNPNWFKISNNLRIKYSNINTEPIKNNIYNTISNNITDLVFHSLVSRGILNEFKVKHKKEDIEKSFDGYYFLTQTKYNELSSYRISEKNPELTSFTKEIFKRRQLFAMNWLQQIHFFKHFFHQRVIYVTGGTGTGKSTQVPKLLLYGLYLLGNYSGKVINTQPRINATTGNAERISSELGVPIKRYSIEKKEVIKTDNYFVQYSTGDTKHDQNSDKNAPKLNSYLKIVTDGTLLELVKQSPFLLGTYKNKKNESEETIFNAFDVISIDEAHEHNANMDLLMTFLRDTVQLNNSLRLVIITATIDADEPIYRRYYKYINDNFLYPLNNHLFTERDFNRQILVEIQKNIPGLISRVEDLRFDSISLDRRLHISAPLSTTIFNIEEHYESNEILTYADAETLAIKKANELTKVATGDILLFSVTEPAINKIVTELNNSSSIGKKWIAIPYYRKLSSKWKDIVENININISSIDVDRRDILLASTTSSEYRKVQKNTYERAIIVCTNIAEASITIDTLKYVIDTGYVNLVAFDPILKIEKNGPVYITETSRIQRKGRVGRVSSGTVYYMYKKDSRKSSTINYNITLGINKLVYSLIDFIKKDNIESLILPDNRPESISNIYNEKIKYQYNGLTHVFFGNPVLRNLILNSFETVYSFKYKSGYDYANIVDFTGDFYIIHPLENRYKRDKLTGKFINPDKKTIKIFQQFFSDLFKLRLIVINDNNIIKTQIYDILDELKQNIKTIIPMEDINYNMLWSIVLGARYNLLDEVLWINTVLAESSIEDMSMKFSTKKGYELSDNKLLLQYFGDTNSDLNVYVNIFKKLKLVLPRLVLLDSENIINNSNLSFDIKKIVENYESRNRNKIKLLSIYNNENEIDQSRIKAWCDQYGLDFNVIPKLLKKYLKSHIIVNIVNLWVEKYKNYIPYFDNNKSVDFIYISSYVNSATSNIDDRNDYKKATKDPFSIVNGSKIDAIVKELKNNQIILKHMISYNEIKHLPAIIPALIYPLENNQFAWKDKYTFYKYITPDMIEKYLLPETEKNKRNKLYNTRLLDLFRLIREKLKN